MRRPTPCPGDDPTADPRRLSVGARAERPQHQGVSASSSEHPGERAAATPLGPILAGAAPSPSGAPAPEGALEEVEWVARRVVARQVARCGALAPRRDDLLQELRLAGWLALERFDPARASLRTFLWRRLSGALLDALRADPTAIGAGGAMVAARRHKRDPAFVRGVASLNFADPRTGLPLFDPPVEDAHGRELEAREEVARLAALDPVGAAVALEHDGRGRRLREVGEDLGISESRACQIRARFFAIVAGDRPPVASPSGRAGRRLRQGALSGAPSPAPRRASAASPRRFCGCAARGRHRITCAEGASRARAS